MSISVVRRFHMDINGASHALTEDEAIDLARALIAALGSRTIVALADGGDAVVEPMRAAAVEPAALPSGPVATETGTHAAGTFIDERGLKMGNWDADVPELRRLHAEGVPLKEIAARLNRPLAATMGKANHLGLRRRGDAKIEIPPLPIAPDPPALEPTPAPTDELRPVAGWTLAQTKSLIREMGIGQGGLREAAARTGHTMGSCALRWRHLKEAGLMTMEAYIASPEAVLR